MIQLKKFVKAFSKYKIFYLFIFLLRLIKFDTIGVFSHINDEVNSAKSTLDNPPSKSVVSGALIDLPEIKEFFDKSLDISFE